VPEGLPPHQKIRFARGEICNLDSLPSAQPAAPICGRRRFRARRLAALLICVPLIVVAVALGGIYLALSQGVGSEALRQQAERSIGALAGHPVELGVSGTRVGFAGGTLLSAEIEGVRLVDARNGQLLAEVGSIGFGTKGLALLSGQVRLGSVRLANARLALPATAAGEAPLPGAVTDERGLIDADRLGAEMFRLIHHVLDGLEAGETERVELADVVLSLGGEEQDHSIVIETARLERVRGDEIGLEAAVTVDGRPVVLEWTASRPAPDAPIAQTVARLTIEEIPSGKNGLLHRYLGKGRIEISGQEGASGFERVELSANLDGVVYAPGRPEEATFDVVLSAYAGAGYDKAEISQLMVSHGRSLWRFHGAVGPMPVGEGRDAYRYELVSDGSHVSPEGSLETAIDVLARVSGVLDPELGRLEIDEIAVRTADGEVNGSAALTFVRGKSLGIDLEIDVADFAVSDAKQLWPWFAARGAREWAHENLFGGRVLEGRVSLAVAPGRLEPGVVLGPEELSGRFDVERVRFDVAGRIPPVRDGVGSIRFDGPLIDIRLQSGAVYLPSGRSVAASRGSFLIDVTNAAEEDFAEDRVPLIGELDIDVAGGAAAIIELAGYEPIDVNRYLDFGPEDFSGEVSGKIVADIPLRAGFNRDDLDWMVMLDYADLTLARPFNGHEIAQASGSILVEPDRVVIDAAAQIDGMPARVNLVEPLGGDRTGRSQNIALELNDAHRDRLMPGLANILSGKASVELQGVDGAGRAIGADLAAATLSIPWAGWTKGAGIPASASFVMDTSGARTVLENFALGGETFSVNGRLALEDGQLASARFDRVRLNRGDDVSVSLDRAGGGYRIGITGSSFDARSLIKQLTRDADAASDAVEGLPITIEASLDEMRGFHGEALSQVRLDYRGTGSKIERLEFSAVTASGRPVRFTHSTSGSGRQIAMNSTDAGALVRFLDIYERMEGGSIELALSGVADEPLTGHVNARDFWVVNEPRLGSIVSSTPAGGDRSLNQAVRSQLDAARVQIERLYALVGKGPGFLSVNRGVLRGPSLGTTFRGLIYDSDGNMDLSGTFIPAYGLNRIFGEIPLIGRILGNGPDGGLIGITYRLSGSAGEPQLQINPLSVVAPGIFRSVFEFN
jgi:hypothetical protein